jgi:hypothetical protein
MFSREIVRFSLTYMISTRRGVGAGIESPMQCRDYIDAALFSIGRKTINETGTITDF